MNAGPWPPTPAADVVLQGRGTGIVSAFQDLLGPWGREVFAAVTHLGDTSVLLAIAALVYLAYNRRTGAFVLGALFCAFAVTIAAKVWFAWPRPPTALWHVAAYGFGFPSGHALGATVGWGALAIGLDAVGTRSRRAAVAGVVVVAVAVSRVAIGVHYPADVVVGVAVGLAVLGLAATWLQDEPLGLFGLAAGLAALAVVVSGATVESVLLLGACVGAVAAWQAVEPADRPYGRPGMYAAGGGSVVLVSGLALVAPANALAFGGGGLATIALLAGPAVWNRWLGGGGTP